MTDKFRLDIRPSDIDVDHANWLIDRQSARIQELAAERDAALARAEAAEAIIAMAEALVEEAEQSQKDQRAILEGKTDDQ